MFSDQLNYSQKSFGCKGCELTLKRNRLCFTDLLFCSLSTCILALVFKLAGDHLNVSLTLFPMFNIMNSKEIHLELVTSGIIFCVNIVIILHNKTHSEVLMVIASVGISIKTISGLGGESTEFFSINQINDVVIIEAVSMQSVVCYLAIVLNDGEANEQKIYPLYKTMKPSLTVLQDIYRNVQMVLPQTTESS